MSTEQSESTTQLPAETPAGATGGQPPSGPPPEQPAEWGAPPPPAAPKSRWTTKRIVIAVVVALGIAAAGGVAIYAASGSVDNSQNGPAGGGGPRIMGGPMGGFDQAQHGEFQVGEVTALSDDSVTVKSEDGYEHTYAITSDTQKSDNVAKGGQVTVIASTKDGKSTADSILELGNFGNRRNGGNGGPPSGGNFNPPGGN